MFLTVAVLFAAPSAPSVAGDVFAAPAGAPQSFRLANRSECQNECLRLTRACKRRGEDGCYRFHQKCWSACERNWRS
jgi:uncharacterized cupin superfamily protein